MRWIPPARGGPWERFRRVLILVLVVAVPWVPGGVALAMLLSGHA